MKEEIRQIRKNIVEVSKHSGHGHIPSCFSVVEILYSIYSTIKHKPNEPKWDERDIFILSKGHGSLALYCTLAKFGYFDIERVHSFGAFESDFGCHADRLKIPGIEASTGSLGHGIGIAVGCALAKKIKKSNNRVYTIIGDGESNEGTVWEAVMAAVSLNLTNLTIIYDNNRSHARGLQIENPAPIFKAFGCDVSEVDGHDVSKLKEELPVENDAVRVIVANTKKGYGSNTLINNPYEWHRKSPNDSEYESIIEELYEETV